MHFTGRFKQISFDGLCDQITYQVYKYENGNDVVQ